MTEGSTPKQMRSLKESIWMPKHRSPRVLSFLVEAIFPSNMSQMPEISRQISAPFRSLSRAKRMPENPDSMPR